MTTFEQPPAVEADTANVAPSENKPLKFPDRFGTRPKPTPPTVPPPPAAPPVPTFSLDDAKNLILVLRRAPLQNLDEADIVRESLIRFITHVNAFFSGPTQPSPT